MLPEKTIQRLSKYRRLLTNYRYMHEPYIYSHDLARLLNINPVQVRRDLMLIGSSGNNRKGYNVNELIDLITKVIDTGLNTNLIIVGFGRLGQAICNYLRDHQEFQKIVAAFDVDVNKINKQFPGVYCYDISKIKEIIKKENAATAILTTPDDFAGDMANILIESGISGILNFTSFKISSGNQVYIKDFDIVTTLEEIGYFGAKLS